MRAVIPSLDLRYDTSNIIVIYRNVVVAPIKYRTLASDAKPILFAVDLIEGYDYYRVKRNNYINTEKRLGNI